MARSHSQRSHKLRDWGKFVAGLVLADLIGAIWFVTSDLLPRKIWGITWTEPMVYMGIAFDIFLLTMIIHFAWHPKALEPTVTMRGLFLITGILTSIVAVVHVARLAFGWQFAIGTWQAPLWLSWIAVFVTIYIAYTSFHFMGARKK